MFRIEAQYSFNMRIEFSSKFSIYIVRESDFERKIVEYFLYRNPIFFNNWKKKTNFSGSFDMELEKIYLNIHSDFE